MLLKKIKLENIRSYVYQELDFLEGSLLLSGDVGSGKSTILLAIDFALFGFSGQGAGSSLLRNGADNGFVELYFELDGKDVIKKKSLNLRELIVSGWITYSEYRTKMKYKRKMNK